MQLATFKKGRDIYNCALFYKWWLLLNVRHKNNSQLIICVYTHVHAFLYKFEIKWNKLNEPVDDQFLLIKNACGLVIFNRYLKKNNKKLVIRYLPFTKIMKHHKIYECNKNEKRIHFAPSICIIFILFFFK